MYFSFIYDKKKSNIMHVFNIGKQRYISCMTERIRSLSFKETFLNMI